MDYKNLQIEVADKIAVVALNNSPSNSLKNELLTELDQWLDEFHHNPDYKIMILTGAGKTFASGAEITEINKLESGEQAKAMSAAGQKIFMKLEQGPKPVIAAINGFCLGGGLELAMSCHIRIASDRALLGLPEISLGIIPGYGGTQRLPRLVGTGKAAQMILTGDPIRSDEALAIGLVNAVVPKDQLVDEAKNLAKKIAGKSGRSVQLALQAIHKGMQTDIGQAMNIESACFGELYGSAGMKEGIAAYLEKRKPDFKD
jgi:enoyl-CoA hydratase